LDLLKTKAPRIGRGGSLPSFPWEPPSPLFAHFKVNVYVRGSQLGGRRRRRRRSVGSVVGGRRGGGNGITPALLVLVLVLVIVLCAYLCGRQGL
jgi:hypothetical protein